MTEYQHAERLAHVVLDNASLDPDGDLSVLARCLLRTREALERAQEQVCSNLCPSTWKTGERPPHSKECQGISYVLGKA
jgi:hypothetical protein